VAIGTWVARLTPNLIAITSTPPVQQGALPPLASLSLTRCHLLPGPYFSHRSLEKINTQLLCFCREPFLCCICRLFSWRSLLLVGLVFVWLTEAEGLVYFERSLPHCIHTDNQGRTVSFCTSSAGGARELMASQSHRQVTSDLVGLSQNARSKFPAVKEAAERALMKLRTLNHSEDLRVSELLTPHLLVLMNAASPADMSLSSLTCIQRLIAVDAVVPGDEIGILHAIQAQVWFLSASRRSILPELFAVLCQITSEAEGTSNHADAARQAGLPHNCRIYPNFCESTSPSNA